VFSLYFSKIFYFVSKYKRIFIASTIALVLLASIGLSYIKYDNNIELMLPKKRDVFLSMRFLRQSHFADKAVLSLSLKSDKYKTEDLIQATQNFSEKLVSPLISKVNLGFSGKNPQNQINDYLRFTPQIISSDELLEFDSRLNEEGVKTSLKNDYYKLLSPGGSFMLPFISADPLGVKTGVLSRLNRVLTVLGQGIIVESGHFLSLDKRHALIIIDTKIPLTDGFGSRKLIDFLTEKIKLLPEFVQADIIAGHMHSLSNEDVIKKDIQRTVVIAMIAFLSVFLLTFKDLRALIFLIIPVGAVIIALNISSLILGKLSYFIVGLGAVIVGIADDYGIHTYVAVHTSGRRKAVVEIAKPLVIAALTTISVFVTFFFSSVEGYHQLALFSITSILLCLVFVLFIFPHFLKENTSIKEISSQVVRPNIMQDRVTILAWAIIMVIFAAFSLKTQFNSDISELDGSTKEVILAEKEFKKAFNRKEDPAMLVVTRETLDQALERTEEIYPKASSIVEGNLTSFTSLWPSLKNRKNNSLFWKDFWKEGREEKVRVLLDKYSVEYNFSKNSFFPFFQGMYKGMDTSESPEDIEIFRSIKDKFIQRDGQLWQVISFFPDRDAYVSPMAALISKNSDMFIVSRKVFSQAISNSIWHEVVFLSIIALLLVLFLTVLLLRDIKLTFIALVSVFSSVIAITGVFSILGKPLNAAVVISLMMVIGLCIDYGVFMLYSFKHRINTGTVKAIWVSALTTLIGAFSLLFAKHPVLFSVGLTLVSGLTCGYICSQTVIPALYRIFVEKRVKV
jgi:predicted exporter